MSAAGVLIRDREPGYYVYRMTWRGTSKPGSRRSLRWPTTHQPHPQARAYDAGQGGRSRAPDRAVNAQTGPVMLAYPSSPQIDAVLAHAASGSPISMLWPTMASATSSGPLRRPDHRHADRRRRRSAGALHCRRPPPLRRAARVAAARGGQGSHSYFLAVLFPQNQMTILDYNRVLRDLNGHSAETVLAQLQAATPSRSAIRR